MPKKQSNPRIVRVEWADAVSRPEWLNAPNLPHPVRVATVGWLAAERKRSIVVAGSRIDDFGQYGDSITIPRGMILSMEDL